MTPTTPPACISDHGPLAAASAGRPWPRPAGHGACLPACGSVTVSPQPQLERCAGTHCRPFLPAAAQSPRAEQAYPWQIHHPGRRRRRRGPPCSCLLMEQRAQDSGTAINTMTVAGNKTAKAKTGREPDPSITQGHGIGDRPTELTCHGRPSLELTSPSPLLLLLCYNMQCRNSGIERSPVQSTSPAGHSSRLCCACDCYIQYTDHRWCYYMSVAQLSTIAQAQLHGH